MGDSVLFMNRFTLIRLPDMRAVLRAGVSSSGDPVLHRAIFHFWTRFLPDLIVDLIFLNRAWSIAKAQVRSNLA